MYKTTMMPIVDKNVLRGPHHVRSSRHVGDSSATEERRRDHCAVALNVKEAIENKSFSCPGQRPSVHMTQVLSEARGAAEVGMMTEAA